MAKLDVYADGVRVGYVNLLDNVQNQTNAKIYSYADDQEMTIYGTTWVAMVLTNVQGTGTYTQGHLASFSFNGTLVPGADPKTNLNLGITPVFSHPVGSSAITQNGPAPLMGPSSVTDNGLMYTKDGQSILWSREKLGSQQVTVTIDYDKTEDVGSIGLAFAAANANRPAPKWVLISSDLHAPVKIDIDPLLSYYCQYDKDANGNPISFLGISSLTLTFPAADDPTGWATAKPDGLHFGLTEFQAFAPPPPIPEPATMSLLALGGLALLRRRK